MDVLAIFTKHSAVGMCNRLDGETGHCFVRNEGEIFLPSQLAGPLNAKTSFLKINDGIIILRDRVLNTQQLIMNNLQQL